jgi:hypothetical protein
MLSGARAVAVDGEAAELPALHVGKKLTEPSKLTSLDLQFLQTNSMIFLNQSCSLIFHLHLLFKNQDQMRKDFEDFSFQNSTL